MRNPLILSSILMSACAALWAQGPAASDAAFARDLSQIGAQVSLPQAAEQLVDRQAAEKYSRQLVSRFSWYGQAEQKPALDAAQLAEAVVSGFKQGAYDAAVFGESHSNAQEQDAAKLVIGRLLDGGVPAGAFLQEATTVRNGDGSDGPPVGIFPAVEGLAQAQVPLLLMKNQFNPEADVAAGLKAAGDKDLITYSGSAHTSERMRDYIIDTLKDSDLGWGNIYPGRPVIEQSLKSHHKKPVIIAMEEESFVFRLVLEAALKDASKNVALGQWQANLAALKSSWDAVTATFQPAGAIRFIPVPEQQNFYVGIAGTERRPLELEAIQSVAAMPELAQWLGDKKVKGASAGEFSSSPCPADGSCCLGYQVFVDKGSKDQFSRSVCAKDLP